MQGEPASIVLPQKATDLSLLSSLVFAFTISLIEVVDR